MYRALSYNGLIKWKIPPLRHAAQTPYFTSG